jgi:hypothetical protein
MATPSRVLAPWKTSPTHSTSAAASTPNPLSDVVTAYLMRQVTLPMVNRYHVTGSQARWVPGQLLKIPFPGKFGVKYGSARSRIKDNKTIGVADEDAPEEYRGQQAIFLRRQGVFPGLCWSREGYLLYVE